MKRKKIILILFLVVLIVGAVIAMTWSKRSLTEEQKVFADKFAKDMQMEKNKTATATNQSK
jgi:flagellar basal body-associated protein FliL